LKNSHEIISTRLVSKMSPCIFEPEDFWSGFFHKNVVGRWLVDCVWWGVDWMWRSAAWYDRSEDMERLKPERPVFWSSDGVTVVNSRGMWDRIAKTKVLRDEIEILDGEEVILRSGRRVRCDAVVACTGWTNMYPMFSPSLARELGLPLPISKPDEQLDDVWEEQLKAADAHILERFPRLATQPSYLDHKLKPTPSRLYRAIVPIKRDQDHAIAFLGTVGTTQSLNVAEIQALWAVTYLNGKMALPDKERYGEGGRACDGLEKTQIYWGGVYIYL
jgi:hypothetical protein